MTGRFAAKALLTALLLCAPCLAQAGAPGPYAAYAEVLGAFVAGGVVDYPGLKARPETLRAALAELAAQSPDALAGDARKAYYINAYNAWTIDLVVRHYPVASIRKIGPLLGTPWQIPFVKMGGTHTTLDTLENDILRREFDDPRIHFALNCASKGCPPLAATPYLPDTLDEQLDRAARDFLAGPGGLILEGNTLRVSALFDWFQKDFGGKEGVLEFCIRHAPPETAKRLQENRAGLRLAYLPYDWSLNGPGPKSQNGDRP